MAQDTYRQIARRIQTSAKTGSLFRYQLTQLDIAHSRHTHDSLIGESCRQELFSRVDCWKWKE
jgi:hypothetical protein